MNNIYNRIIDFVFLAKKLEFKLRSKYEYEGASIFRGKIEKAIPFKGCIELEGIEYEFYFHGLGIDFKSNHRSIHYNHYAGKDGLGVYFTIQTIFEEHNFEPTEKIKKEFESLIRNKLIKEWMPEMSQGHVYYLV